MTSVWSRRIKAPIFAGVSVGSIVLTAIAVLAIFVGPVLLNNAFYMHILQQIAFYTIAAIGLNLLVGYQGQVSLGHGGLFAVGAYASALLATRLGMPVWVDFVLAAAIAGLVGALLALPTLRAKGPYLAMVTIAFSIVTFVVAQSWTDLTRGPEGIKNIPRPEWFGVRLSDVRTFRPLGEDGPQITGDVAYFWVVALVALAVQIFANNLLTGRWGRTINAVRQSEIASETVGVSVYRMKVGVFAVSAVLAGLSGALFAHQSGYIVSDTFTFNKSVELLVFVILGGARTLFGPVIGTTVLVILPEALKTLAAYSILPAAAQPFVEHYLLLYGALLILFLITMPNGMAGALRGVPGLARLLPPLRMPERRQVSTLASAELANGATRPALVADDIKMYFGGLKALDGVTLNVQPGKIHGLIGPNGSGKSTMVNVLTGVYRPTGGQVRLGETVMNNLSPHSVAALGVTRTFQNIQLFKDLSVLENVMMGFHLRMRYGFFEQMVRTGRYVREETEYRQRAMDLLAFLDIAHLAEVEAQSLPYGLQRLVEIARALALGPSVLILDEPAAGINASEIDQVSQVIRRVRDAGVTILVIEHHMDLVMGVSDHVAALDYGKRIAEGTPTEIQANARVIEAYLGDANMFVLPEAEDEAPAVAPATAAR
ncbi:MAG: branched-chain amino acid ABC transporter ATP-binding protein/permease [Chloroflexi bacterium]|nr:branched-chain amino acid ABC transporter ATP-binding protein/permease [Chloroflexota bacterium]